MRPRLYHTEAERREAGRARSREWYHAHKGGRQNYRLLRASLIGPQSFAKPSPDRIADAARRNGFTGTLTAEILGDPKPGQSALDKKRARDLEKMFLP